MASVDLDRWVSDPVLLTRHRRISPAAEDELWAAAAAIRLRECRVLGRLIRTRIPGLRPDQTFDELFGGAPFTVLEEGRTHRLSGLCGRIWTVRRDYGVLRSPEDFVGWAEPGTVRVLFAHWTEPSREGSALVSESRIDTVDRRARLYLRALEPFISAFQGLIATEPLSLAAKRAAG